MRIGYFDCFSGISGAAARSPLTRRLAEHALEKLSPYLPQIKGAWTERAALQLGDIPDADFSLFLRDCAGGAPRLPAGRRARVCAAIRHEVENLLNDAKSISDLGRRFGGTFYEREARFLAEEEWAIDAEDILERRTKHALHLLTRSARILPPGFKC